MATLLHAQTTCLRNSLEGLVSPVPPGLSFENSPRPASVQIRCHPLEKAVEVTD